MEWIEAFVQTSQEGLEIVAGALYGCGLTGLQIEDENDFQAFLDNPSRDWDYIEDDLVKQKKEKPTGITFFVRENVNGREQLAQIQCALQSLAKQQWGFDLGTLQISMKNVEEEDWANNWKKYFKPFPVGEKIMVKPSWEELAEPTDKIVLKIDPGHIFGTGTHETTQLCIELIEQYVKQNDSVLDIGCGSGILSIAALLLDAKEAYAVDIDPNAVDIAYENSDRNAIARQRYIVQAGNILEDEALHIEYAAKNFDVVVANIVADVIIALSGSIPDYIKPQGIFIASGIILDRLEDVKEALREKGFTLLATKTKRDWAALCFMAPK